MRLPKLLNADFEQSLNLLDDVLVNSYKEWWSEKKKFGAIAKIAGYLVLLFLIWVCSASSVYSFHNSEAYIIKINFFPFWLCWVIMAVFLLLLFGQLYGMGQNWKCMEFYNLQVFSFWYCLTLLLAFNLFAATLLTPILTIYGMAVGCIVVVTFLVIIFQKKVREITVTLYDLKMEQRHKNKWVDKVLTFKVLIQIGFVILACYYIYKFIFYSSAPTITPPLFLGAVIGLNIIIILMVFYLFFPCVIEGYYRNKYAEEYRNWEGKTQIEWYGEKYFNKHIKGTEKEEKI